MTIQQYLQLFVLSAILVFGGSAARAADAPMPDMGPAVIFPDVPDEGPVRADLDQYGGWTELQGQKTGFFHVEKLGERWWFITPEGNAYFMVQLGWTNADGAARAKSWGFNAAEQDSGLPYEVNVNFFRLGERSIPVPHIPGLPPWTTFPDVFDPEWARLCEEQAQKVLGPIANDPMLLGYFMVNEMSLQGWYEAILHTTKDAPARAAFVEVARTYYANKPEAFAADWKTLGVTRVDELMNVEGDTPKLPALREAWIAAVAERGFSVAANAARAADPNHLNLGVRMINAPLPEKGILDAMGKYCDVISMNLYSMMPDRLLTQMFTMVPAISAFTGRPTMSTEFSYRGGDTLHPNTMGALPTVKTQAERAIGYLSYVTAMASLPTHIGVSWYKYPDDDLQKPWGEYAEDCNFGVIDPQGRPYAVLSETMRATNSLIYDLAKDPVRNKDCPLFWKTELMRWDLELDESLLGRMSRIDGPFVDPVARMQLGKRPRHFDPNYWVSHHGEGLIVNDPRFVGWCQGNIIRETEDGTRLVLLNVQAWTTFPRSLWLGAKCDEPEKPITLESNAQYLERRVNFEGRLVRLTIADGSYIRTEYNQSELRVDRRVPYLDLRFDPYAHALAITTRGTVERLGVAGVTGWSATWNGAAVDAADVSEEAPLTVFSKSE